MRERSWKIMEKKTNNIFLDLDNTLICSYYVSSEEQLERFKDWYGKYYDHIDFLCGGPNERYITFLRPIAYDLIGRCERLVGEDNLYILTLAIEEYACYINNYHGLGIDKYKIYCRGDLCYEVPKFHESNNILVDNEDYWYHSMGNYNKKNFLRLEHDNLIQIKPFADFDIGNPGRFLEETENGYLDTLMKKIESRIKH